MLIRWILLLWARSGKCHGILYSCIARYGNIAKGTRRRRRTFNGIEFECDLRDHIQQQIYFYGAYEPVELSLFISLIPKGGTAVDAGANIGFYTLMLSEHVGAAGQIHAFEPVGVNFERLARHTQINGNPPQIHLNKSALWNRRETLTFHLDHQHRFNPGGFSAGLSEGALTTVLCPARTLSDYFAERQLNRLDAIKMDIEGAELFALQGSQDLLKRFRPVILLEISRKTYAKFNYSPEDLWKLLRPLGYRIYLVDDTHENSGWRDDFSAIEQRNVLILSDQHAARLNETWNDKDLKRKYLSYP